MPPSEGVLVEGHPQVNKQIIKKQEHKKPDVHRRNINNSPFAMLQAVPRKSGLKKAKDRWMKKV
tara:strand:- start:11962 stop:12153 length:192 start_codon:yes stop_codon:yes gene_type:complete